jgi:hypothetical protein
MTENKKNYNVKYLASQYDISERTFLSWLRYALTEFPALDVTIKFYKKSYYGYKGYSQHWRCDRKNLTIKEVNEIISLFGPPDGKKHTLKSLAVGFGISQKTLMTAIKDDLPDGFWFNNIPTAVKIEPPENEFPVKSNKKSLIDRKKVRVYSKINCLCPKQAAFIKNRYAGEQETGSQQSSQQKPSV